MKSINFQTLIDKPSKQQALKCIKQLNQKIPIAKFQMKVRSTIPIKSKQKKLNRISNISIRTIQKQCDYIGN